MKTVGEQLEKWAIAQTNSQDKDIFGRSAFNRYYYSIFLITRKMLGEFDSSWKNTPHKEIPNLLKTSVITKVKKQLDISLRKGILGQTRKQQLIAKLTDAASELANLLIEAYDVRLVADYEPEIAVHVNGKAISLNQTKLSSAQNWSDKASAYSKIIRSVWVEVGLA